MKATFAFFVLLVSHASAVSLQSSIDTFTVNLFLQCRSNDTDSIMSPFSVHDDLTMAALGARGITYCEMLRSLNLNGKRNTIAMNYESLLTPFHTKTSVFKVANGIYIQQGLQVQEDYATLLATDFYTVVTPVNFGQSAVAAAKINQDVATATNNKIQNIISPSSISADTRLVLVNSVYFHSNWLHKFDKGLTQPRTFYTAPGASGSLTTMRQTNFMMVGQIPCLDATLISLPYVDQCFSFNILFPNSITGLRSMEDKLKGSSLSSLRQNLESTYVQLDLPSFKTETSFGLNEPLKNLGIRTAFTDAADFGNMIKNVSGLSISSVLHKAYIKVDENGTEAAAATAIVVGTTAVIQKPEPVVIKVNHPFLYFISDCKNNTIFIGHFYGKSDA